MEKDYDDVQQEFFYENPTHLLNVASYVKEVWDSILSSSIKNPFCSAEFMNLKARTRN